MHRTKVRQYRSAPLGHAVYLALAHRQPLVHRREGNDGRHRKHPLSPNPGKNYITLHEDSIAEFVVSG